MNKQVSEKLDEIEKRIMNGLKDFQRATVERIDELYRNGVQRVLVSDEVGLGKTLIARGTIAKFANLRKEKNDNLVKVVYVCSNATIAEQNLNKLKITQELSTESMSSSRLSMQHLNIFLQENDENVKNSYIQLIPLTPDTSFRITSGTGTVAERSLMFAILKHITELEHYLSGLETLMMGKAKKAWKAWCKGYYEEQVEKCNDKSNTEYLKYMRHGLNRELNEKQKSGMSYLDELISVCKSIENNEYVNKNIIGKLRLIFAELSLERLEPDLVILDEFQRFRFLLNSNPKSETGMLAKKFFENENVRMLLLSATPYKMYSTMEEIDETLVDEHYSEFLELMKFLTKTDEEPKEFELVWKDYSMQLKKFVNGSSAILEAKNAAEDAMYNHICRTERIEALGSVDLIDDTDVRAALQVSENDIKSYIQMQKLLDGISSVRVPTDYVKSCPYLLSFMRDYKLKKIIESHFKCNPKKIRNLKCETFFLRRNNLDAFNKISCNNARLENILHHTFDEGKKSELLLWVPPSKPYYLSENGPYCNSEGFTKILIFSTWEMVPRMIAVMLSYEAERRTIGKLAKDEQREVHYFHEKNDQYPRPKLNFVLNEKDEPAAMSLFCLTYPSKFLADCYNPIDCLNKGLTLKEIRNDIEGIISKKLSTLPNIETGLVDQRWYYLAPLVLENGENDFDVTNSDADADTKEKEAFNSHLNKLNEYKKRILERNDLELGKRPEDLVKVLVDMAIASPAICIYRSYRKYGEEIQAAKLADELARIFLNRMNTPEWTAVVDICYGSKNKDAHWKNVLSYCKDGNLQAMFDEYVHLLSNGVDLNDNKNALENIHSSLKKSMSIRTTTYNIDTFNCFKARLMGKKERYMGMRSHFAVAFTKGDGRDEDTDRKNSIRNAFNSPFRPFVLASTSIGQEGLDFHNYCRRIVHWNLPSNPIDLEQREGRINRFECLAIRQNVAIRYGEVKDGFKFKEYLWKEMFERARECEHTEETSDLVPYWGLKESENMVKIERIVPMYPMSRDVLSYERLIKILSLYRLTLGQARQEELLEYIFKNCDEKHISEMRQYFINLSPYYKK